VSAGTLRRPAQRCWSLPSPNAPRTTGSFFWEASLPRTLLAVHSRIEAPIARTSKPEAQLFGSRAQRGSQIVPDANSSLSGPLQARSHSSSVQSRPPRSAQCF
jgi:hypothetical protein